MTGRDAFSSRWLMLLVMLGMAVGTGNIWRFPYLVGKYGMDYGFAKDACLPYNMTLWERSGGGRATVDDYLDRNLPCERLYEARGGGGPSTLARTCCISTVAKFPSSPAE